MRARVAGTVLQYAEELGFQGVDAWQIGLADDKDVRREQAFVTLTASVPRWAEAQRETSTFTIDAYAVKG